MATGSREPSRLPVRGTIATVGTVGALAMLLSFRGGPLAPGEPVAAQRVEAPATDELVSGAETDSSAAAAVVEPLTVTGDPYRTRWGEVQVEVTRAGSDITEVVALAMPGGDRHTDRISAYVEPILRDEAISSDSAEVSVISGATYTSRAYAASLQSALDQAGPTSAQAVPAEEKAVAAAPADASTDKVATATGDAYRTRWGEVQVEVTRAGSDITEVVAVVMPGGDRRTDQISAQVEPILRDEAISSDSAEVSVISGATYTSKAYARSLQSALDRLDA
jgi:uncharacterized protein with FMN-binding domain